MPDPIAVLIESGDLQRAITIDRNWQGSQFDCRTAVIDDL
ncbi:uncharacterized protein METZ01_LOCUS275474, partial [marine metagenome]